MIKKKLAFSDDEQLSNEKTTATTTTTTNGNAKSVTKNNQISTSDNRDPAETDYDYTERFNSSAYHHSTVDEASAQNVKHKRSSSLTREAQLKHQQKQKPFNMPTVHSTIAGRASRGGSGQQNNGGNYDFRSIYEAFEKPIHEMAKRTESVNNRTQQASKHPNSTNQMMMMNNLAIGNRHSAVMTTSNHSTHLQQMKLIDGSGAGGTIGRNYKVMNNYEPSSSDIQNGARTYDNYIDKQKIAAAIEKEK